MKILYLGTPDFAVKPLEKLIEKGYNVVGVVTNKDKPVGRKQVLTPPPVKVFAEKNSIPVFQYDKIRLEGLSDLRALAPDLMITCAFGQILSQEIIDIAPLGVINIHASLLPKFRGASPIHYAILNGEKQTGISIMKTDIGIDTGDVIYQESILIGENETCGELFDRLSVLGADCIVKALPSIIDGSAKSVKQNEKEATFTKIIKKDMAKIDWNETAENIVNKIRAFNPSPVAFTFFEGNPFKIYSAKEGEISGPAGQILCVGDKLVVGCKKGSVVLETVQKAGGKAMSAKDFLRGTKLSVGDVFTNG